MTATRQKPNAWNHQVKALDFIRDKKGAMLAMEMGTGKDLDNETYIPTPEGWTLMGGLQVGQQVFDEQGKPCTVTAVYPQGEKPVYNVRFDDGAVITAGDEHLWITLHHDEPPRAQKDEHNSENWAYGLRPKTTGEIRASMARQPKRLQESMYSIPLTRPLEMPETEITEDPYLTGIRLSENARREPIKGQPESMPAGATAGATQHRTGSRTPRGPGSPGRQGNQRIPPKFLRASIGQRTRLLQGLIDSNGTIDPRTGGIEFRSVSQGLAGETLELALSLGQKAIMSPVGNRLENTLENKPDEWRVVFQPTTEDVSLYPFIGKSRETPATETQVRSILSVEPAGATLTTCITVDSPSGLFLAGRQMVPTHNTRCAIDFMDELGARNTLVMCPLSVVDHVWPGELRIHGSDNLTVIPLGEKVDNVRNKMHKAAQGLALATARRGPAVVIVNYDSAWREPLASFLKGIHWDLLVMDECHPEGTPIATPDGPREIQQIQKGDPVWGVDHTTGEIVRTQVTHTFRRENREELIRVRKTLMTPEHPVWTGRGYIPAREIKAGDRLCRLEEEVGNAQAHPDLRMVPVPILGIQEDSKILREAVRWESLQPTDHGKTQAGQKEDLPADLSAVLSAPPGGQPQASVLMQGMRGPSQDVHPGSQGAEQRHDDAHQSQTGRPGKDQGAPGIRIEPLEKSGEPGQVIANQPGDRIPAPQRGERDGAIRTRENPGRMVGMANGARGQHWEESTGETHPPQDRHRKPNVDDRNRSGRTGSQDQEDPRGRPPEGNIPGRKGLNHPQVLEQGSVERPGPGEIPDYVFNIETGTGNYFAAGLLVHNSHRIKSASGKASRFASQVAAKSKRRLALSGTPMPHSPLDIYAQYRALDMNIFGDSNNAFKHRYAEFEVVAKPIITTDENGNQSTKLPERVTSFKNLAELNEKFFSLAFRVTAADTLDLPGAIETYTKVDLCGKARAMYEEMALTFRAQLDSGEVVTAANALTKLLRFQQLTSGFAATQDGKILQVDTAKTSALTDIIEDLPRDEPIVVFARFQNDLDAIRQVADKAKRPHFEISGRVKQLEEWRQMGGILAVQIQAGGLGLDLTAARYCVYYSLGFNLGDYLQSIARLHRPGQSSLVDYIHLVAADSIDEIIMDALADKEDVINRILETRDLTNGGLKR